MFDPYLEPVIHRCNKGVKWWKKQIESQDKSIITFYPNGYPFLTSFDMYFANTYNACMAILALPKPVSFSTVQMCLLMEPRVKEYDVIRIFNYEDDVIDIINRHDGTYACDRTSRELRCGNNLYKLWVAGEFELGDADDQ